MPVRAFLFPGQGSQYVGMGKELNENFPEAEQVFSRAEKWTELPLKELCFNGPIEDLTLTVNLQPAVTAVNLAILACLEKRGFRPDAVAGHSLGEYSALYAARVITLEDTFKLVRARGALMDRAAKKYPGSMAAVMGVSRETLADILAPLSQEGPIGAANYNTPEQTVISGVRDLVERASQRVAQAGGKALPLAVSGAWHSPLMGEAMEAFQAVLQAVPFQAPRCPVFLNVTGGQEKDPAKIKAVMSRQMGSPVFWVDLVNRMPELGISQYLEVGPKKVLLGLLKKCLPKDAAYQAFNVEDQKSLEAFLAANPG